MYIKSIYYIQYNCRCCALKKGTQRWRFPHFQQMDCLQTYQGVSIDSLVVGAIEIGCKNAPDRQQCHQEAPKRSLATPTWFLMLLIKI